MDELSLIRYINSLKESGDILDAKFNIKSNKDIDVYVVSSSTRIKLIFKIETDLYIKRDLGVVSVSREGSWIKALTKETNTVFIKILEKGEGEDG